MEQDRASDGPGINKIKNCCVLARHEDLEWVWVDTCCIDKKSSAELTEAINSMFSWYERAEVCYVHLSDVTSRDEGESYRQFERSQWFTRGWTLQELLAPRKSVFFNAMWEPMGTKKDLSSFLAGITNINDTSLCTNDIRLHLRSTSVAERMSWAALRVTTRKEDEAYCLLGIFGINMPLLYGEGARAFRRLQLEIIKESSDESIFAWGLGLAYPEHGNHPTSVLATSPRDFDNCKHINEQGSHARAFSVTNLGLKIRVPKQAFAPSTDRCSPSLNLELHCRYRNQQDTASRPTVLHLHKNNHVWQRWLCFLGNGLKYSEYLIFPRDPEADGTKVYLNIQPPIPRFDG